ncbi:MAG: glycosyltransferase family 1 protein [Bacteroidota bacterium]|nr:glycosyltransferase family 1 protein [Bacteroidota bacterium]
MNILYDYNAFIQNYGGVSRYFCEIIKELSPEVHTEISVLFSDNVHLHDLKKERMKHLLTSRNFKGKRIVENRINKQFSIYKLNRSKYDIFHHTYFSPYFLKSLKAPLVITVHDMILERYAQHFKEYNAERENKKQLIYKSDRIIAVSEHTRKDILELYPVNPDKISVIYHGWSAPAPVVKDGEFGRYLLFVGNRSNSYKNFSLFAEAVTPILMRDQSLKLICTGSPFTPDEERFLGRLGIQDQAKAMLVSDTLLYSLYRDALVFVYPSLYEGFGIPILEAFSNNCPVCLSAASCFPEIASDAALYFDPESKESIAQAVEKVIYDPNLSEMLRKRGSERLKLFSWKRAAAQTLEVYKSIL